MSPLKWKEHPRVIHFEQNTYIYFSYFVCWIKWRSWLALHHGDITHSASFKFQDVEWLQLSKWITLSYFMSNFVQNFTSLLFWFYCFLSGVFLFWRIYFHLRKTSIGKASCVYNSFNDDKNICDSHCEIKLGSSL